MEYLFKIIVSKHNFTNVKIIIRAALSIVPVVVTVSTLLVCTLKVLCAVNTVLTKDKVDKVACIAIVI